MADRAPERLSWVENELAVLGAAMLLAGLFARLGRRLGPPTIPFFILAGIVFGPQTPGVVILEDPHEIELLAMLGLVLLLFHLGIELSINELLSGGRRLLRAGGSYIVLNFGAGLVPGWALGWGTREMFIAFYLALLQPIFGESDSAADVILSVTNRLRVPARAVRARPLGRAGRAPADRQRRCGALDHPGDGLRRLRRRLRPLRGSVRRGRRAAGRHGRGGDGDRAARGAAAGAAARRLRRDLLLLVRPDDRAERHGGDRARRDRRGRP